MKGEQLENLISKFADLSDEKRARLEEHFFTLIQDRQEDNNEDGETKRESVSFNEIIDTAVSKFVESNPSFQPLCDRLIKWVHSMEPIGLVRTIIVVIQGYTSSIRRQDEKMFKRINEDFEIDTELFDFYAKYQEYEELELTDAFWKIALTISKQVKILGRLPDDKLIELIDKARELYPVIMEILQEHGDDEDYFNGLVDDESEEEDDS